MAPDDLNALSALQAWYLAQCDGTWEHGRGISITTLDNPGWHVKVNLAGTPLDEFVRDGETVERSEHDWVHWKVEDSTFDGACGPTNLAEVISAFIALTG